MDKKKTKKKDKQRERKHSPIYALKMKTTQNATEKAQKEKVSDRVTLVKQETRNSAM